MTFLDLQNALTTTRFGTGQRTEIKNWINTVYAQVWGADDWPFKKVAPTTLSIVSGTATPTMPSDLGRVTQIYDDLGNALEYFEQEEFETVNQQIVYANTRSRPSAWTVVNNQVRLAPIPNANYTFKISYERSISHLNVGGSTVVGLLSADDDAPIWNAAHHYLIAMGAMTLGLQVENDPTWDGPYNAYQVMLQNMRDDILPDRAHNLQYGADSL